MNEQVSQSNTQCGGRGLDHLVDFINVAQAGQVVHYFGRLVRQNALDLQAGPAQREGQIALAHPGESPASASRKTVIEARFHQMIKIWIVADFFGVSWDELFWLIS